MSNLKREFVALIAVLLLPASAGAGGPLVLRANGAPFVWSTSAPILYRTDDGPLSASVGEVAARARVDAIFDVWQNVPTSNIAYNRAGFIDDAGAFTGGDVDTLAEYNAVHGACNAGSQSPIIYDANAAILIALAIDEESVIGFAGPCGLTPGTGQIVSGEVVMNGLFQDGQMAPVPDLSTNLFDAAFVHEFGHFSGLDHSQVNVGCVDGVCSADDFEGLPTMFPFAVNESQRDLSVDDIAWISRLYPQPPGASSFVSTHGTITGTVYFSDGESHAQVVNVIARPVDAGANEDRTRAVSNVSGYRFRFLHGNPINDPVGSTFGSQAPGDIGLYEIPVPAGNYTIEVESIDAAFVEGSSVGGLIRIAMPGTSPGPLGPIAVAAGATVSGNDVVLVGTAPRFDQFEGP